MDPLLCKSLLISSRIGVNTIVMITYFYLIIAILLEVAGTMLLPVTNSFTKPIPTLVMALCYLGALFLLTIVVKALPIAVVYATWSGLGVFSVAIL